MLLRCIHAEQQKLRHCIIFPACIFIPIIPAVMGTFNYLQNTEILSQGWYSLWTQHTLFYACFFYAPLVALYCSYLWRLEHCSNNWNVLMTAPVSLPCLYLGKLSVIFQVTLFTQLWVGVLFFLGGKFIGLPGLPPVQILLWLLRGTLAAAAIGALQLLLSMTIRSFSVPIGISLIGSVLGLLISNKGLGLYWPYTLMLMGMNANKTEDALSGGLPAFLAATAFFFILFYAIAIWLLKHRDIRA
ncbi:ABC transporter permease [Parablautia sp. Marseille-Q6255]|uniref:ABC transporter permease n=1 Tax=Parablautia sp. Marseille-Q6255 TaxID=3039593 RepID=UPI0024BD0E86|nr:ABC transporter permease [Parablautia sp. Marseille-Q6255]